MKDTNRTIFLLLFVLALVVNFSGINIDFFTDDPGLYAAISKNLLNSHSFFQLFTYNQDWLDKPHFPFWCVLLSFKLFGVSVWAYRLPAFVFFTIGLLYTFLFTRKFYGQNIAFMAVLILMTAQHILLSNTDVRAEPYLMALIIGSIYHLSNLDERYTFRDLFLTALFTACAIMTKGVFVIIAIYGSLAGQLLFQRKLKNVFQFKWLWLILLTLIFTLPELYSLYTQFDIHPEKTVFGRHNVSGIKWFLWDSQFGRFVNNGPIKKKVSGSIFFYLHTLLWAFAPWCLLFYYAIYKNVKAIFNKKLMPEYFSFSGGLLLLILFSISRFQLPFYTNAVFPPFAIITAPFCYNQLSKAGAKFRSIVLWIFVIALPAVVLVIVFFLQPAHYLFFSLDCVLFVTLILLISAVVNEKTKKVFFFACTSALFSGLFLNTVFYNELTPYQGQRLAAEYINQKPFDGFKIYSLETVNNIFQFYCKRSVVPLPIEKFDSVKSDSIPMFYASKKSLDYLTGKHIPYKIIDSVINYPQENILPKFVNKSTRYQVLDHLYFIVRQ